jgi:hypothetical protein
MAVPPEAAFAQVNDFRRWQAWSPWEGVDPNLKRTYEGPAEGVGTRYSWDGDKVGAGTMTLTESREPVLIRLDLEFLRPFKAVNVAEFAFNQHDGSTAVSWSMTGRDTFFTKAFALLFNRDKICGAMFEKGLNQMKAVCESSAV